MLLSHLVLDQREFVTSLSSHSILFLFSTFSTFSLIKVRSRSSIYSRAKINSEAKMKLSLLPLSFLLFPLALSQEIYPNIPERDTCVARCTILPPYHIPIHQRWQKTGNMGDFCCVAQCHDLLCGNIHNTNDAIRCMTGCPVGVGTPEQVIALSRCREDCIMNNYSSSSTSTSTWTSASSTSTASSTSSSTYSATSTYSSGSSTSTSTSTSTGAASTTSSSSASGMCMFLLFVAGMLFWVQHQYSGN